MATIILLDNGSTKASATLKLRTLAADLSSVSGHKVNAVSLQHADKIAADKINNIPALTFYSFVAEKLENNQREFIVLPLFFGKSKAITAFLPEQIKLLQQRYGHFSVRVAPTIYPLPYGEPLLADIMIDHINSGLSQFKRDSANIVLVDHGSPSPSVSAVRHQLRKEVQSKLTPDTSISEAVMERRKGKKYDFNGKLLEEWLQAQAQAGAINISVILMFFLPGRHAGDGGDINEICNNAMKMNPELSISVSPLISDHPTLIEILNKRLQATLYCNRLPCRGCTEQCSQFPFCDGQPWLL